MKIVSTNRLSYFEMGKLKFLYLASTSPRLQKISLFSSALSHMSHRWRRCSLVPYENLRVGPVLQPSADVRNRTGRGSSCEWSPSRWFYPPGGGRGGCSTLTADSLPSFASCQGFKDDLYRQRRKYFVEVAMNYKLWVITSEFWPLKHVFVALIITLCSLVDSPFPGWNTRQMRPGPGAWSSENLPNCTRPTPAKSTWRTCRCSLSTVATGRTTSRSWRMSRSSSEVCNSCHQYLTSD